MFTSKKFQKCINCNKHSATWNSLCITLDIKIFYKIIKSILLKERNT